MLITIRVPKETVKMQIFFEDENGYECSRTVTMGDIIEVKEEPVKLSVEMESV